MSTRGAVAWGNLQEWTGVYNHYDSYPDGLGEKVWGQVKKIGPKELVERLQASKSWDDFERGSRCPYCGAHATPTSANLLVTPFDRIFEFKEFGIKIFTDKWYLDVWLRHTDKDTWTAHQKDIRGDRWNVSQVERGPYGEYDRGYKSETDAGLEVIENFHLTGFPDPELKHHEHSKHDLSESQMTHKSSSKLHIEWVYIIDQEAGMLHVLHHGHVKDIRPDLMRVGPVDKGAYREGYAHWLVESVPLAAEHFPIIRDSRLAEEKVTEEHLPNR